MSSSIINKLSLGEQLLIRVHVDNAVFISLWVGGRYLIAIRRANLWLTWQHARDCRSRSSTNPCFRSFSVEYSAINQYFRFHFIVSSLSFSNLAVRVRCIHGIITVCGLLLLASVSSINVATCWHLSFFVHCWLVWWRQ